MSRGKWVVAPKEMKTIQVVGRTVSGPERVLISFIARFGTTSLALHREMAARSQGKRIARSAVEICGPV